jgi:adenylate cyclase
MRWSTQKFSLQREVLLPRQKVWELLSNTDHLNRVIDLFPVHFSPVAPGDPTLSRKAEARVAGLIPIRWQEYPFQWVKDVRYSVVRVYEGGPLKRVTGGIELADTPTVLPEGVPATRVWVFAEVIPANILGVLLARVLAGGGIRKTMDYCRRYLRLKEQGKANDLPQPRSRSQSNEGELERRCGELERMPVRADYIPMLRAHLLEQGDDEVLEMRPHALASRWNSARDEVLRLCLYATKIGMLNLSWNLLCPNCRMPKFTYATLFLLQEAFHCDLCGVDYRATFDRYVELRFSVHPGIRKAVKAVYCIGGPTNTPHILVQQFVAKGEEAIMAFPRTSDRLRLRVLRKNHVAPFEAGPITDPKAVPLRIAYGDQGWPDKSLPTPAADTNLLIANHSAGDVIVVLEKVDWDPLAVTAAGVLVLQEFRELFSSEVLTPGVQVGVEHVAILFSDLLDSTALYEAVGDGPAYGRVRRHFDYLIRWIGANSGGVVKTIGDAVMAVFASREQAVKAALDIQKHVSELNASLDADQAFAIKLGIHCGATIAINSNDRMDYFGRTVNLAARLQKHSRGGDIVMTTECAQQEKVRAILAEYAAVTESFPATLKGVKGRIRVARVWIPTDGVPVKGDEETKSVAQTKGNKS